MKKHVIRITTSENARVVVWKEIVERENILAAIGTHLNYLGYISAKEPNDKKKNIIDMNEVVIGLVADGHYIFDNENETEPLMIEIEILTRQENGLCENL